MAELESEVEKYLSVTDHTAREQDRPYMHLRSRQKSMQTAIEKSWLSIDSPARQDETSRTIQNEANHDSREAADTLNSETTSSLDASEQVLEAATARPVGHTESALKPAELERNMLGDHVRISTVSVTPVAVP